MANVYCGSTKYTAVTAWTATTTLAVGAVRRQSATPTVGNERCFRVSAITTGITGAAEPTWVLTANATTTDAGVTWTECTGQAAFNGDGGGTAWGAPHARIANAGAFMAAGDTCYVSNNHAETQSSAITYPTTWAGTQVNPLKFICVTDTASPPVTTATTATVSTTGAISINFSCPAMVTYGISFNAANAASNGSINIGNNAAGAVEAYYQFEAGTLKLNTTSATSRINVGAASSNNGKATRIVLKSMSFVFGSTSQKLVFGNGIIDIIGGNFATTGTAPNAPNMVGTANTASSVTINGMNMAAAGFDTTIATQFFDLKIFNCNIGTSAIVSPGTPLTVGARFNAQMFNSPQDANTNFIYNPSLASQRPDYGGSGGAILTGGATDGATPYSYFISPGSTYDKTTLSQPLVLRIYNSTVGTIVNVTVEFNIGGSPTNKDIWMDVEYYSNASVNAATSIASSSTTAIKLINSTSGTALTSSSASWTGPGVSASKSITVAVTPQQRGDIVVYIYAAPGISGFFIDPRIVLS